MRETLKWRLDSWYNYSYTNTMKTAISLPDSLFEVAERLAKRLGISRSKLFQRALTAYVGEHKLDGVTEALNRVHAEADDGRLDPLLEQLQTASLPRDEW